MELWGQKLTVRGMDRVGKDVEPVEKRGREIVGDKNMDKERDFIEGEIADGQVFVERKFEVVSIWSS